MTQSLIEVEPRHNGERLLRLLQKRFPEYHPILHIADIAHKAEAGIEVITEDGIEVRPDLRLALSAHQTVLQYVEPSLKSVDVKIEKKDERVINVRLFEDAVIVPDQPPTIEGSSTRDEQPSGGRAFLEHMADAIIAQEVAEAVRD